MKKELEKTFMYTTANNRTTNTPVSLIDSMNYERCKKLITKPREKLWESLITINVLIIQYTITTFVFPDIADFPDVKNEPKYQSRPINQSIDIMKEAIQKNDLNMFQNELSILYEKCRYKTI